MKIALLADIHANVTALKAVLADIAEKKADQIICMGDMVGKGPDSAGAVDLCREHCDVVLMGNWEDGFLSLWRILDSDSPQNAEQYAHSLWHMNRLTAAHRSYLSTLPYTYELVLSGRKIRLFHAHPTSFRRYYADAPREQLMELLRPPNGMVGFSDIAVYADIHSAYLLPMGEGRLLANTGSVGNSMDIPLASYIMLEGEPDGGKSAGFSFDFVRVPYDIAGEIAAARASGQPDLEKYITEITSSIYQPR